MQLWKNNDPKQGRDPARVPVVLGAIEKYWGQHPELRLGQLLVNIAKNEYIDSFNVFNLEDDELMRRLIQKLGDNK